MIWKPGSICPDCGGAYPFPYVMCTGCVITIERIKFIEASSEAAPNAREDEDT